MRTFRSAKTKLRLAIVVSHPIQYYVPLYQLLAQSEEVAIKVFFTWHAASGPVSDRGFRRSVAWDIPVNEGYDYQRIPNVAPDPGTHHFWGLVNPSLVEQVMQWMPDAIHITGWAFASHLYALQAFHKRSIPTLFRGDSHLLDEKQSGPRWLIKSTLLRHIYRWPSAFLVTGKANRAYYNAFGVPEERLFSCPHSVEVERFAEPNSEYELAAARWRHDLGIAKNQCVLVFAGKFEPKKRPLELMKSVAARNDPELVLVLVGSGELQREVDELAAKYAATFRVLPFQNQRKMPIVYRLGDLFVLPSSHNETWGLAVNEALASNRPVLVSDRVGCHADVIDASCGRVFTISVSGALDRALDDFCQKPDLFLQMKQAAGKRAKLFDISTTAKSVISCLKGITSK